MDDINRVTMTGEVANEPAVFDTKTGQMAKFRLCSKRGYKDNVYSNWSNVVVYSQHLLDTARSLKEGDRVLVEGTLQTRSYEKDGTKIWTTEVVMNGFTSQLITFNGSTGEIIKQPGEAHPRPPLEAVIDDEIPF